MPKSTFFRVAVIIAGLVLGGMAVQRIARSPTSGEVDSKTGQCVRGARIQFTASPSAILLGQSSRLHWAVAFPAGCSSVHIVLDGQPVAESGTRAVFPPRTTTYRLRVSGGQANSHAETSVSARVELRYPPRVVIDSTTVDPASVLVGALSESTNETQTVELCDVDIDLTGYRDIDVTSNRSLVADPACARGPRRYGPRVFVTDVRAARPLFRVRGDNVVFSGFRLQGPTYYMGQDDRKEKGILIQPLASADAIRHVEIYNMDMYYWSGLAVQVSDRLDTGQHGRMVNTNVGAVHIHDNYFHHNRHGAGLGYGVDVTDGAYALIEHNVFQDNRHAIAGGSRKDGSSDYSGYIARDNLVLAGGGLHCTGFIRLCWQTHQLDMHGDESHWYSGVGRCGTAGETIIIERNTVLYTAGPAIRIRGNPTDKAVVSNNVFALPSEHEAIAQNGECGFFGDNITNPIDVRPSNTYGADPMKEYGLCDFAGDGKRDRFVATGVTWWALSPATDQWRFLNSQPELRRDVDLADVDGDGVCDVVRKTRRPNMPPEFSKSGTGPWVGGAPITVHP